MTKLFKIGEVADLLGINASTIRFWETKFKFLRQDRPTGKHRYYSEQEVQILSQLCKMLKQKHYKITGAQIVMADLLKSAKVKNDTLSDSDKDMKQVMYNLVSLHEYVNSIVSQINNNTQDHE